MAAMHREDKEMHHISCSKMDKFPKLMKRYFETTAVMHANGLIPFLHAQSSIMRAAPIFLETLTGRSDATHFKYFRDPSKEFQVDREALWNKIVSSDFEVSSHILSMSYSIFESQPEESANYFAFSNSSIDQQTGIEAGTRAIAASLRRRSLQSQIPDIMKVIQRFQEDYAQLKLGTLYLIGVPKESLDRFVYDSEAYGKPTGLDVRQVIDRYAFSNWNHKAPQARLMLYDETMDARCGLVAVDISDAKETERYIQLCETRSLESSELFSFFFPDQCSEVEEEDQRKRTQIDAEVRLFANKIADCARDKQR